MRSIKIANEITKQVTAILSRLFPQYLLSVTKTDMVDGLKNAVIFISIYSDDRTKVFREIIEKRILIRKELASKIKMRRVPNLRFELDLGLEVSQEMSDIISELKDKDK